MNNQPMTLATFSDKWGPEGLLPRAAFDADLMTLLVNERAARKAEAAPKPVTGTNGQQLRSGLVCPPYGRAKGLPIEEATASDLKFYIGGCERTLADESKSRWHSKERVLLAALQKELESR